MKSNVGGIDRVLRIVVGGALVVLSFVGPFAAALNPWGLIGLVPLASGLIGWCPAYMPLGLNTCKK